MNTDKLKSKATALKLVVLIAIAAIAYVWRPFFHWIFYNAAYSPGFVIVIGSTAIAGIALFILPQLGDEPTKSFDSKMSIFGTVVVAAMVIALLYSFPAAMVEQRTLASETMDDAVEVDSFPEVNEQNPRITPRAVSDTQTSGSVSYRQHKLGTSDIARTEDGRLAWSYAIEPGPFKVGLTGNQRGVLLADMTTMEDREILAYDEQDFAIGKHMFVHRGADWNLKKTDYWTQYRDEPVEFTHNGTAYMAYPKTGHEWKLGPLPHTIPVWDGVALIHPDGTIDHLSPEEAQNSEILDGQRLYPIYNAEREASSLGYRAGILNQMPVVGSYKNVVEVADMPSGAGNSQPFVIDLEGEEMAYVIAMEPHGASTRGLDEVWFFSAETGEKQFYGTGDDTLLGPERAMGIVRSEDSQTGWASGSEGGNFQVVEPIPVVIDDQLWWHSKVVPIDQTDVTRNVFVNAHEGEAVELHNTEAVIEFMGGEEVENISDAAEVGTEDPENVDEDEINGSQENVSYYIVVENEDGEVVERIPVREGQETNIRQAK